MFATDPGEGSRIRNGGTVAFNVSKGPDLVVVPASVVDTPQAAAETALKDAGLTLGLRHTRRTATRSATVGNIISAKLADGSDIVPGAQVVRGTVVTLVVSAGHAEVTITSVVGLTVDDATKAVQADALTIAPTEVFNDTVPAGQIIDQSPIAGTKGHRTDMITVDVSKGPDVVALPSMVGQDVTKAQATLQAAGFVVKLQQALPYAPLHKVYSQNPGGGDGKTAPRGATITLTFV